MRLSAIFFILPLGVLAQKPAFILIGDSTTNNGTSTNSGGWSNGFCSSLQSGITCINTAKNGATTTSFVADGYWATSIKYIKAEVAQGKKTYATLQFGHNDQKVAEPEVMGANLVKMVDEIRAAGAEPILLTPLTRRNFGSDGKISNTLGPWATATEKVATDKKAHVLALMTKSITYCEAIGADACHRLNKSPTDYTHLNTNGTIVFGRMVANLMQASYSNALPIVANDALTYNIEHGIPSY